MSRSIWIHALVGCLALSLIGCEPSGEARDRASDAAGSESPATTPQPPQPPREPRATNLILITLDTTRADALGAYGETRRISPVIDGLATSGVLFEQASSASPETLPSHSTIFTGRWPFSHGVRSNAGFVLSDQNVTLAEHLRARGYSTGAEVAAPVLRRATQVTQGFDHYRNTESKGVVLKTLRRANDPSRPITREIRIASDISKRGVEFLRRNREHPFFLWLHYFDAHLPHAPPLEFAARAPDSWYHAEIAFIDAQIGRVLLELGRLGLREHTLVVVTADHGEGLGDHGENTHSYFVYQSTMRVPLIFSGLPTLPAGKRVNAPVRSVDIAPTALELMGQPPLPGVQGTSLAPLIAGRSRDLELVSYGEATQFMAVFELPILRSLRVGHWKYIHKVNPELYDIARDPAELQNVADSQPETLDAMRTRLEELLRDSAPAPADGAAPIDSETARQLAALGYAPTAPDAAQLDEVAALDLHGEDPNQLVRDVETLSKSETQIQMGRYAQALERLEEVRARNPENAQTLGLIAKAQMGLGQKREALETLAALYEVDRSNHEYLNNYAWALATLPDPELRDGAKALEIAKFNVASLPAPDPAHLDTLAAAYAETGDFENALRTERQALELCRASACGEGPMRGMRGHLEALEAGRPLREP